jgi:hypothetical protein
LSHDKWYEESGQVTVTLKGFLMKVSFFIIAFTLDRAFV